MVKLSHMNVSKSKAGGPWAIAPKAPTQITQPMGEYQLRQRSPSKHGTNRLPHRTHDHTIPDVNLPVGLVEDHCDQGTLWDPTLSAYYYSYDVNSNKYTAYNSSDPTSWLYFVGKWGDDQYPLSDPRQKEILDIPATAKYVGGPTGPEDKQLNRTKVCPDNGILCIIRSTLGP